MELRQTEKRAGKLSLALSNADGIGREIPSSGETETAVFIAVYNETTPEEIKAAIEAEKAVFLVYRNSMPAKTIFLYGGSCIGSGINGDYETLEFYNVLPSIGQNANHAALCMIRLTEYERDGSYTWSAAVFDDLALQKSVNAKYAKPAGGIPLSDLSAEVRDAIENASGCETDCEALAEEVSRLRGIVETLVGASTLDMFLLDAGMLG